MKLNSLILALVIFAAVLGQSHATTITLDFTSLPSAQGWTYFSIGPLEKDVYSVDGTKLIQNTLGTGFTAASYQMPGIIDPSRPFTIDMRARVIQSEEVPNPIGTGPASALLVEAVTGTELFGFGLNTTSINAPYPNNGALVSIDGTQFHDYRIEADPGVSVNIFVDNALLITQAPPLEYTPNRLDIGNNSGYEKGYAEITAFSFQQTTATPEPSTIVLMSAGFGCFLVFAARGRGHGCKSRGLDSRLWISL